mgnify:CR=1 FL=1
MVCTKIAAEILIENLDKYRVSLDTRNNKRVMFDDRNLAEMLWERVAHIIVPGARTMELL